MRIYPAIDLYQKKAVRLYKGDYNNMTIYSEKPVEVAEAFKQSNAKCIHLVDLEGAKDGTTPNIDVVKEIKQKTGLFCEIGGGIRSMETINAYLNAGLDRVILGTAAIENKDLLKKAIAEHGDKIAVGADVKDGYIAIKGWVEKSQISLDAFCREMQKIGVKTVICTDISKDGAMKGPNVKLYEYLKSKYNKMKIIASGGVSNNEDIDNLTNTHISGAIVGKAYYEKKIDLAQAIKSGNSVYRRKRNVR